MMISDSGLLFGPPCMLDSWYWSVFPRYPATANWLNGFKTRLSDSLFYFDHRISVY